MPITGLEDDVHEIAVTILDNAASDLLDDLRDAAPFETGELRDSAYGPEVDEGALSATIGFLDPAADWTNEGVAPHEIFPRNVQFLKFYWTNGYDGPGWYYFRHVNHPGQEGTHWFDNLIEQWDDYVTAAADAL